MLSYLTKEDASVVNRTLISKGFKETFYDKLGDYMFIINYDNGKGIEYMLSDLGLSSGISRTTNVLFRDFSDEFEFTSIANSILQNGVFEKEIMKDNKKFKVYSFDGAYFYFEKSYTDLGRPNYGITILNKKAFEAL
jgi:hypothetical protein